ncbi:hypothetical protein [Streptomyces malaysiensis]|uniref:hypothetical protein n=1 Tax=Streptomyces malaysiensis TaxID=92644 RepID=UPI0008537327|nr:hypothetical protein [Streptomyces sp. SPMA113]
MTTMHRDNDQGQPFPRPSILDSSFDDFLTQAEHELVCHRREVHALRRRARRQRRRELRLRTRAARFFGKTIRMGLAIAGTLAFVGGTSLLITGNVNAAKDAFALSAAAWGAVTAVRTTRN